MNVAEVLIVGGVIALGALVINRARAAAPSTTASAPSTAASWVDVLDAWQWAEPDQTTTILEDIAVTFTPSTYTPAPVAAATAAKNERAFLDMIAWAEGTSGKNGYRMLFGGSLFDGYADHPRIYIPFRNTTTSAAGRYQILARTWDVLQRRLGLPDFSPASQDAAALELVRERGALNDVRAGRVPEAIAKVAKVWASLPGAGYNQPERQLAALMGAFASAGGTTEGPA